MKSFSQEIVFNTKEIFEFTRLTAIVEDVVSKSKMSKGLVLIKSQHTTGAVVMTEKDQNLHKDTKMVLENLLSLDWPWSHIDEGKENARAHQAVVLLGSSVTLPLIAGQMNFGTWQDIFFVECLKGQKRKVEVSILGE